MTRPPDTIARVLRPLIVGLMAFVWTWGGSIAGAVACPSFAPRQTLATYWNSGLKEVSGIQSSLEHPGVLWAVQDSGNGPHLYALNADGHVLDNITLKGANIQNVDWEAIALDRRRNGRDYIYIGDVGDNAHNRNGVARPLPALYRLREPKVSANWTGSTHWFSISSGVQKFPFRYYSARFGWRLPPRNAEAMFVDPPSHEVVIIQKDLSTVNGKTKRARVFTVADTALKTGRVNRVQGVGAIRGAGPSVQVGPTAADISADGRWIVVKNYSEGFIWQRGWNDRVAITFKKAPVAPCHVSVDASEAITFGYSGGTWTGFLSLREARRTGSPPLERFPKK